MTTETPQPEMRCRLCQFRAEPGTTMKFDMQTQTFECADKEACNHRQEHQKQT